jgi:hypothetical protein
LPSLLAMQIMWNILLRFHPQWGIKFPARGDISRLAAWCLRTFHKYRTYATGTEFHLVGWAMLTLQMVIYSILVVIEPQ